MNIDRAINIAKVCVMASVMDSETKQMVIESLDQMFVPKTETTSCEWCEIARVCKYEVTFFEDDDRCATERSLLPKYCPNCGRLLEEKIMEVKRTIKTEVESFELGDVITFKLKDGEKVQAKAVKQTDEGMLFITVDCLEDEYQMFKNPDGMGSMEINYINSDLRHHLNGEILDRFPDEIRSRMVGMRIGNTNTFDLLRIPTEKEIFGENPYGTDEADTVTQFKCMKNLRNRIAFQGYKTGTWECYCLQNRVEDTASDFAVVGAGGGENCTGASYSLGVRPTFLLS